MKTRAVTSFFFVIVMFSSLCFGDYFFSGFYLLLSAFCLWEFYKLFKNSNISPNVFSGIINCIVIYLLLALIAYKYNLFFHKLIFLLPLTVTAVFVQELFKKSPNPISDIFYTFGGLVYACVPFTFFHAIAFINGPFNFHYPLVFLLLLWANDTGAYLVGIKFGRHKLFERHSPKKTWEGFIGGIVTSCLVAFISSYFFKELFWYQWTIISLLICFFGTLGDLVESMFKRSIDVKDSGEILPGHGGLLDRFDGLLLAAPIVYTYLYLISIY